jgi:hypothetical protein
MASGGTLNFSGFYLGTGAEQTIGEFDARTVEILNLSTGAKTVWAKEFVDLETAGNRGGLVQLASVSVSALPVPEKVERTGLVSGVSHVHSVAGPIYAVVDAAGTTASTIVTGTPGAGEVQITYSGAGLATLVFPGAVTEYTVLQSRLTAPTVAPVDFLSVAEGISSAGDGSAGFTVGTSTHVNDTDVQYWYKMTN